LVETNGFDSDFLDLHRLSFDCVMATCGIQVGNPAILNKIER